MLCTALLTPRVASYIVNSRKALQVAAAQRRGRDDADDKNGGTPYGTPAPRYTATFGSVPNPQSQMHGGTTLSIAVRNVKHVEESQLDEDQGMHVRRAEPSIRLYCFILTQEPLTSNGFVARSLTRMGSTSCTRSPRAMCLLRLRTSTPSRLRRPPLFARGSRSRRSRVAR